ncbi:MAG TPA: MBL fold metallo-hydrolase [Candidatus Binatia bacterium]|nr:MBL fold metallo-hydrolase [Candidatus Binatia bacterium]
MRVALLLVTALCACSAVPLPRRSPYHASDADVTVTRITHASLIVDFHGTRLLVDPWFHSGFIVRQTEPLGLTPEALPALAGVVLTHRHDGHFDATALRALAPGGVTVVARPELHERLARLGFEHIVDLAWWDHADVRGVTVTAVPARHAVAENGYVLELDGVRVYVAGDTRWYPELVDVATRFPHVDAALLPIGGERLLGFAREMGPADAARAAALLDPRHVIPVGYGKRDGFPIRWHARHPVERFVAECKERGIGAERIVVLEPGESWHYYR